MTKIQKSWLIIAVLIIGISLMIAGCDNHAQPPQTNSSDPSPENVEDTTVSDLPQEDQAEESSPVVEPSNTTIAVSADNYWSPSGDEFDLLGYMEAYGTTVDTSAITDSPYPPEISQDEICWILQWTGNNKAICLGSGGSMSVGQVEDERGATYYAYVFPALNSVEREDKVRVFVLEGQQYLTYRAQLEIFLTIVLRLFDDSIEDPMAGIVPGEYTVSGFGAKDMEGRQN